MEMKLNVGDAIARFQEQMTDRVWSKPKQIILIAGSAYIAIGQGTAPRVRHSSSSEGHNSWRDVMLLRPTTLCNTARVNSDKLLPRWHC